MKAVTKKMMVVLLILLLMSSCSKKGDVSPNENESLPGEETSGFSFSKDEEFKIVEDSGNIYLVGDTIREVNFKDDKLVESGYIDGLYTSKDYSLSLKDGQLLLKENGEDKLLAQGVMDFKEYEDRLLYSESKGIFLLQYSKKLPQLIRENVAGETSFQLENFTLMDKGKYILYNNEAEGVTEIYLSETLDHVTDFEGQASATSWQNDSFLFEDQGGFNRIGYYQVSTEEVSKFNLTTDDERVLESPKFDDTGLIRFISDKNGILSLNKLDPQSQTVKKINMMKTEDLLEEAKIDGYYTFRFKSYFYYSDNDSDYHFYALESDRLNFSDNYIFVTKGDGLKIIQKDSFKSYSLKGTPIESLGTDQAFYYTYDKDGKLWLDRVEIDL